MSRARFVEGLIVAAALATYVVLAVSSLRTTSAVFDEGAHLPAGYSYWAFGDFRLNTEHPPLLKLAAAAPLLFMDVRVETDTRGWVRSKQWDFGRAFLYEWNDADHLLQLGRLPVVAMGAVLALAVYTRGRRYGAAAGLLGLALCVSSPDVLAHGTLVTTDLGIALFIFLSVITFERLTARATWGRLLVAGLALGGAFASKFSAIVLLPILALLGVVVAVSPRELPFDLAGLAGRRLDSRARRLAFVALLLLAMAVVAWLVVWSSYGFHARISPDPEVAASVNWEEVAPRHALLRGAASAARRSHLLPDAFLFGFLRFFHHSQERPAFLRGELSREGWWYYFPVTFALKTPVPLLLLGAAAAAVTIARRRTLDRVDECFLWLPIVVYATIAVTRSLNIGHRHLLPLYPFLFVAAGRLAAAFTRPAARAAVVAIAAAWSLAVAWRIHPHYLAYFNELAGGPQHGYEYLVDSNLDWGQDLKRLKGYLDRSSIEEIKLSYLGTADPAYYGIRAQRLPGHPPPKEVASVEPGDVVVVSATHLQGVYLDHSGRKLMRELKRRPPIGRVGYSLFVFQADFSWRSAPP